MHMSWRMTSMCVYVCVLLLMSNRGKGDRYSDVILRIKRRG